MLVTYICSYVHTCLFLITNAAQELQYQPPPTCPANHVPRVKLLKAVSSAILNSAITPTIGTTVAIRGIGGIGKSTIAKALCHDPLIKEHFINGFLWISLTPPLPNPMTMLSEIYQRLTGKSDTPNVSILINKIKCLVFNPSCKLLVILDDIWKVEDVMMFVDVFSSCKTVLTTRKMNINEKIPSKVCFDIKPMSIKEAVMLLVLNIFEIDTLHATDVNVLQTLAKDLHCWPLLLNLVHGQLYVYCIEWNESPQDAISKVQQKLFDNGLTAFDPENQIEASRENAVRASITASLELLTKDEEIILYYIASSFIGFGTYTIKDFLSDILKIDTKRFDKYTRNLWCHGLISFQDVTFPNVVTKIPCIGIHEVIAHYINENMPDKFFLSVREKTATLSEVVPYLSKLFHTDVTITVGLFFLVKADAIFIPFWIRLSIISTKLLQLTYFSRLNQLVEQNVQLLQNDVFTYIQNNQFTPIKHMHKIIEQDCESIHSLLADGKYSEAITWAKQYFDNHPYKLTWETIITNFKILFDSCKQSNSDYKLTLAIEDCISHFEKHLSFLHIFKRITTINITGYNHVIHLVNALASDGDILHYLKCSRLY